MKAVSLQMLPTDTTHSHSQVVPLTISVKQHVDQMENLFSLPRSLVLFRILSLHIESNVSKVHPDELLSNFFLQNFACLLILCGKYSAYLKASLLST